MAEVESFRAVLGEAGAKEGAIRADLDTRLAALPNVPDPDVPVGEDEHGNVELRRYGEPDRDCEPQGPRRSGRWPRHDGLRGRRADVRRAVRGAAQRAGAAGAGARPVHARPADPGTRLHGGLAAAAGALRGGVRRRPAAEVRRGSLPHHGRPLADLHRRSLADQSGARADHRRGGAAAAAHRADAMLPLRGRRVGQGHPRHDPPAPVLQGGAGLDHHARSRARPSTSG